MTKEMRQDQLLKEGRINDGEGEVIYKSDHFHELLGLQNFLQLHDEGWSFLRMLHMRKYILFHTYTVDLNHKLGQGATAQVYLGYHSKSYQSQDSPLFAIKSIPLSSKFQISESVVRQVNLLRRLQHPNVVHFIDARKTKDSMYLILEYCEQGTLEDLLQQRELTTSQIIDFLKQIVSAFLYISSLGIFHRDIKPRNLLLSKSVLKVADFGQAIFVQDQSKFSGTLNFIAPEILRGQKNYDQKCDVWSMGVTLYYMLFKELPWNQSTEVSLFDQILKNCPSLLENSKREVDPLVSDLLLGMLSVDRQRRLSWREVAEHKAMGLTGWEVEGSTRKQGELKIQDLIVQSSNEEEQDEAEEIYRQSMQIQFKKKKERNKIFRKVQVRFVKCGRLVLFLLQLRNNLISCSIRIDRPLLIKSQFLLAKRAMILVLDLYNMLSFSISNHGIIHIPEQQFFSFVSHPESQIQQLRDKIEQQYIATRTTWYESCQMLFSAIRHMTAFTLQHVQETYTDQLKVTLALTKTFSKVLAQLFVSMSKPIVELLQKDTYRRIKKSRVVLDVGYSPITVHDLLVAIQFERLVREETDMSSYEESVKKMEAAQLLHRIKVGRQILVRHVK